MTAPVQARSVPRVEAGRQPDAALLARVRAGDESALALIYDAHVGVVYGLARRVTRDEHLAQDITQEVFTYLWELPDRVDLERGSLRSYLAVLAHRRAVDEVRRSERRARSEASLDEPVSEDGPETAIVDTAAAAWSKQRIADVLAKLPDEQRAAICLAYFDGLTYTQVAHALGIPEGTAKSRLRLALGRLRALLGEELRTAMS